MSTASSSIARVRSQAQGRRAQSAMAQRRIHRRRLLLLEPLERRLVLACPALPVTTNIRGKNVQFDQCYSQPFAEAGTNYDVQVFYTETDSATNLAQCNATENANGICEHALANADDGAGNNLVAVAMAAEGQAAFQFYLRRNLKVLNAGGKVLAIYIAEDQRGGGTPGNGINVDDDDIDNNDTLSKRQLAYHEIQHLVQVQYDGSSWHDFYGEGVARAIEDRVDAALDADTGHYFIPEVDDLFFSDAVRTTDMLTISYQSVLWWTWLMDQYRTGTGADPPVTNTDDLGWSALRSFYLELETQQADELGALGDFIADQGSTFRDDFIAYTLALYAFKYNPTDPRLGFIDAEINALPALSGHNVINIVTPFAEVTANLNARSSQYWEFGNGCDYTAFSFDGKGKPYGFSVMTVDGGNLLNRWTSYSDTWARTVRTKDLDRVVGVVSAFDQSGTVDVGRGCVQPTIDIKSPNTASIASVGTANAPRTFIVRLDVSGQDGSGVAGLTADAFTVTLTEAGGGPAIPATIVNSVYVLDDYWLLVQAPTATSGAENGQYYDLTVKLGATITDTEGSAVLYQERTEDVMIVLDRSGSMGMGTGKLEAAQNAANLLVNQLTSNDQAGYVRFDTNAQLQVVLDAVDAAHRTALINSISAETAGERTSIGDGLDRALVQHAANRDPDNQCSFVLLSDGHENEPKKWVDVRDDVVERGCAVHTISLGPEANEVLMQEIANAVPGGTHDYATTSGTVPIASFLDWDNNLSRLWDDIGTQIGRRQRVNTAAMGAQHGQVNFEDLPVDAQFPTGAVFQTGNAYLVGLPFYPLVLPPTFGVAFVDDRLRSGGSGHDLALINTSVQFELNRTISGLSLQFNEWNNSSVNLWINGNLRNVADLQQLNGQTVDGVQISVGLFGEFSHLLTLQGSITQFAIGGQELYIDNVQYSAGAASHQFLVDGLSDRLVVTVGWQNDSGGTHQTTLLDPANMPVNTAFRRRSPTGTNEVWTVPNPIPGYYALVVNNLDQQYFTTGTVRSHLELHTFIGGVDKTQGVEVPLVASFIGAAQPVRGAEVVATVTEPSGTRRTIELFDDGSHGDSLPNDGVYANVYTRTTVADQNAVNPAEGQEPRVVGSYGVNFVATYGAFRREAVDSFAIETDFDNDGDGMPDRWERAHGLNYKSPDDDSDADRDGVPAGCEYRVGLDPRNSDTDGGGERDGSEVVLSQPGQCTPRSERRNPHVAEDDRGGPLSSVVATAEATLAGGPYVRLVIGAPLVGTLEYSRIERRAFDASGNLVEDWHVVAAQHATREFLDSQVTLNRSYQYAVAPQILTENQTSIGGRVEFSNRVTVVGDPYAPTGSLLIERGVRSTMSPIVDLQLAADDRFLDHDLATGQPPIPYTPTHQLQMRISNDSRFAGVAWQPYSSKVNNWFLGDVPRGSLAKVYAQFRDQAGNVSRTVADTIVDLAQRGDTFPFDGCVQVDDLNSVRNQFGAVASPGARGDAIGSLDGEVSVNDLNLVRNYFGSGVCGGVPELRQRAVHFPAPAAVFQSSLQETHRVIDAVFAMLFDTAQGDGQLFVGPRRARQSSASRVTMLVD